MSGHSPMTTDFMSGAREGPRGELRLQRPDGGAGACEVRTPRVEPRRRSGQEQFLSAHRVTPLSASPGRYIQVPSTEICPPSTSGKLVLLARELLPGWI